MSHAGVGGALTAGGLGTKPVRPVLGARLISTRSPRAPTPEVAGRPSPSPAILDVSPLAAASSSTPSFKATQNESEPAAIDTGDHFRMPERPAEPARTGFISLGTRSSRSPSNDREADELRALIKQLQKEVKELNEENVDFEQRSAVDLGGGREGRALDSFRSCMLIVQDLGTREGAQGCCRGPGVCHCQGWVVG